MEELELKISLLDGETFYILRSEEEFQFLKDWWLKNQIEGMIWDDFIHMKEFGLLNRKYVAYIKKVNSKILQNYLSSRTTTI